MDAPDVTHARHAFDGQLAEDGQHEVLQQAVAEDGHRRRRLAGRRRAAPEDVLHRRTHLCTRKNGWLSGSGRFAVSGEQWSRHLDSNTQLHSRGIAVILQADVYCWFLPLQPGAARCHGNNLCQSSGRL